MNVQGRLTAVSLASQAPGGKIVAARLFAPSLGLTPSGPAQALFKIAPGNFVIRLMSSACRVGAEPASLRAVPSVRIPADRPGQPSTLIDFQPDRGHRFNALTSSYIRIAVQRYSNKSVGGEVWTGPAENCRRVSVRPGEPAWMLAQGALCKDASSRPAR